MDSVRVNMPDYDVRLWSDDDLPDCRFARECLKWKKYALLSDYMRLQLLEQYGGIYIDASVEVLKPFDDLLDSRCFMAFGTDDMLRPVSNAVMGAAPGHHFMVAAMDIMTWEINHRLKPCPGVKISNVLLLRKGIRTTERQQVGDILLLDKETMFSKYCIHHQDGSYSSNGNLAAMLASARYRSSRFFALLRSKVTGLPSYP